MYVWFEDAETRQYIEDCYIPGSKVQIEQTSNIDYAKEKEARVIFRRCGGNLRDSLRGSER